MIGKFWSRVQHALEILFMKSMQLLDVPQFPTAETEGIGKSHRLQPELR